MNIPRLHRGFLVFAALGLVALDSSGFAAPSTPDTRMPLINPGFEQGATNWNISENISSISQIGAEAAHDGASGLRIKDEDTVNGSSVTSAPLPAVPGHHYRVTLWARSLDQSTNCGVYLRFCDAYGKAIPGAPSTSVSKSGKPAWTQVQLDAFASAGATTIEIWIHAYGSTTGSWDVDDFILEDLDAATGPSPVTPAAPGKTPAPTTAVLPSLPNPLLPVVLKVDDLVSTHEGGVPERWKRITDLAIDRKIKLSIGVIANSLEGDKPAYFTWIKGLQQTGLFEFWFHGYDHRVRKENGKDYIEFAGQPYEEQKRRFDLSQQLAVEKLGIPFRTFGPPGGGNVSQSDADLDATVRVMAEDPEMKFWLYPKPIDERGSRLQAAGKVRILDRVWAVNIENPLFVPNAAKFIEGYAKNAGGRSFYIAQGHPAQWDDARWAEFVKLVDFLQENHIPVVTPTEAAASL